MFVLPPLPTALIGPMLSVVAAQPSNAVVTGEVKESEPRRYVAVRTTETMTIDGRADESVWRRARADDRFTERNPDLGEKPPLRSRFRVAYDETTLYFLVEAFMDPERIIVRTLRRDSRRIWGDDAVILKIDPAHDRRTSYNFTLNADGVQLDTLALENGTVKLHQWDAVWKSEARRHEAGWTAEFAIPFAMLGIKEANGRTMGLNVTRQDIRRNADYDWRLIVPPRDPVGATLYGQLEGFEGVSGGRALEYTPYFVAQTDLSRNLGFDPRGPRNLAMGGDARIQVGTGSYVEGSVFTDFAQVEADEVQVARDRFPLFFPERRPFFINGLDVFNFGVQQEAQLFFSRRIGLDAGQPLPILSGAKAYGRAGRLSYGVLNVQTLPTLEDTRRDLEARPADNYSVGRVRVQVTDSLNVGFMALGQHKYGDTYEDNVSGGLDGQVIGLEGRVRWYGFYAGSYAQNPAVAAEIDEDSGEVLTDAQVADDGLGASAYSRIEYRGLYFRPSLQWLRSDENFGAPMGFYRRPGTTRQQANLELVPRPRVLGLREIQFGPRYAVVTDPQYENVLTTETESEIEARWRNGTKLETEIQFVTDEVQDDFELYGHNIEARRYSGFRSKFNVETPSQYVFQVRPGYEFLELFGGGTHQPSLGITAKPSKHFTISGRYAHLIGRFEDPGETFNFGFANGSVDIAFTRNLLLDNLVRVDLSPSNERVGLQTRLRWRFAPGSDIFVVYRLDHPLEGAVDSDGMPLEPFHQIAVKLSHYFRTLVGR